MSQTILRFLAAACVFTFFGYIFYISFSSSNFSERPVTIINGIKSIKMMLPAILPYSNPEDDYSINWTSIKRRDKPPNHLLHDKWIIVTTIQNATSDIQKLATIPGWKVLVVGDKKTPKGWSYPNCTFLSIEDQLQLGYEITKNINFNSYCRKNIGYLYALEHGAKIIYETDDDNSPTVNEIGFDQDSSKSYEVYETPQGKNVMNPYAHFGQSSIWPRGYPLDEISFPNTYVYQKCNRKKALVQQGVVDGDPDVDAIFRLTRKNSDQDIVVYFDPKAEPLLLPRGVMAPYNCQNTLHLYDAFWGLVLPQTVAFRVTDIWRSYWAQRLLWDLDGYLSFFAPNAYTYRNSHSYLSDFIDERELYHLSSSFVKFLVEWKSERIHFFDRVMDLSIALAKNGFWKEGDILLVKAWLTDLVRLGYRVPDIQYDINNQGCEGERHISRPNEQNSSFLRTLPDMKHIKL